MMTFPRLRVQLDKKCLGPCSLSPVVCMPASCPCEEGSATKHRITPVLTLDTISHAAGASQWNCLARQTAGRTKSMPMQSALDICRGSTCPSQWLPLNALRTWAGHVQPDAKICILHYWQPGRIAPNPLEVCSPAEQRLVPKEQPRPPVMVQPASSTLNSTVKPWWCKA